ncbi:MAG TPA: AAA family ATPase [Bacteroidales bacterium]|nr:AAA family ATPase [Bacteroidales bacterium]
MASIIPGYEYDIFISYRQKDNKHAGWVTEFVDNLKGELEATFKEDISVYFDINPHDGLLETHDVDASLKDKLKCLIFIPIISRTYCDPKSFAWEHELKAFVKQASNDQFGLKIILPGNNVASRVLSVRIHDLDNDDLKLCESFLGEVPRGIEFIYKQRGVNRPLRSNEYNPHDNLNHTIYRNQINKAALAVRDIILSMKVPVAPGQETDREIQADIEERLGITKTPEVKKHNLPIFTTSFIGREKEMKEVRDLFQNSRFVTLTGAGGCGKTRLAKEIALSLVEEYRDGVWFTDLAPVADPNLVAKAITTVLKIPENPNRVIADILIENIKDKSLLILLDNCEHLIEACAEIADKLLQSVKGLRILATSREALNIPGEVVWRIPSLSFPGPDTKGDINKVRKYEAIRLFIERASSGRPGFILNPRNLSPLVGICQRVEGIPLAIELAATRIRHMDIEIIFERLEDQFKILSSSSRTAPERQQTLKATIDWSYNLISEQERLLFDRLSVFAGDFSLEAVEEICTDKKLRKENILTVLCQLVDKSLLIAVTGENEYVRYRYLVPLQQYSMNKLISCREEKKYRKRHLLYYLKMAEKAYEEHLKSQLKWLNKLEQDHDNFSTALKWSDNHSPEEFIQLSGALAWFWNMHSHILEGKNYLERASSKEMNKSGAYARVLHGLGMIVYYMGESSRSVMLLNESLKIWRKSENLWEIAFVLSYLSFLLGITGDQETALVYSEESVETARKTGDAILINYCLIDLCQSFVKLKRYDQASVMIKEFLDSSEGMEQAELMIRARRFLADCSLGTGDFREAEKRYCVALETALKCGNILDATVELLCIALSVSGQSRWIKAIRLDAAAREKASALGANLYDLLKLFKLYGECIDACIGVAKVKLGEELTRKYEEEGSNIGFDAAIEYALDQGRD